MDEIRTKAAAVGPTPVTITWPENTSGAIRVQEFIDSDGSPVREVRLGEGDPQRFPIASDIHL